MSLLDPLTRLQEVDWIPSHRLAALNRLGLETLADLIRHHPRRYEDRRTFERFPSGPTASAVCLCGTLQSTRLQRFGGRSMVEAVLVEDSVLGTPLTLRWYQMPWVQKLLSGGDRLVVFGKTKEKNRRLLMEHPEFEVIENEGAGSIHFDRITPVHPAGDGMPARLLRELIHQALEAADCSRLRALWPARAEELQNESVWKNLHFPQDFESGERARRHLVRDVFFGIQLVLAERRAEFRRSGGFSRPGNDSIWTRLESALPFRLTTSQREVMAEISADMAAPHRMNRLLQGDVGSGKTLVALRAMVQAVESGWQAALMAPTQILAEQHYLNFRRLLDPLGVPVLLRTSHRREGHESGPDLFKASSTPAVVVGTHALLFETTGFEHLGLVVIDEQHKFGVLQRTRLIERADAPDTLVMTATPIPRTISQTLYGDLDVSIIRERPAGRGRIVTARRDSSHHKAILDFLRGEFASGRQAYIVCPLVEESEKLDVKAATAEAVKWRELVAPHAVGLVHGKLDAAQKEAVMRDFREGRLAALVSTTVIEVGVDVPNANVMLIEEAGRFGLSQLHQLRGRVGRGAAKSWCILLQDDPSPEALEKLSVMERTTDGFEIAEADLCLRGPGDLLGTAQTGLPALGPGDLLRDAELMLEARRAALDLLESDPGLESPGHQHLKAFLAKNRARAAAAAG